MLVKNAWYIGAWANELGAGPVARRICDEPVESGDGVLEHWREIIGKSVA